MLIKYFYKHCGRYNDVPSLKADSEKQIRIQTWRNFIKATCEAGISNVLTSWKIIDRYKNNHFRLKHPWDKHPDIPKVGRPAIKLDSIKDFIKSKTIEW